MYWLEGAYIRVPTLLLKKNSRTSQDRQNVFRDLSLEYKDEQQLLTVHTELVIQRAKQVSATTVNNMLFIFEPPKTSSTIKESGASIPQSS